MKPTVAVHASYNGPIAKQYDIKLPGQYRVQFNGNGLEVGVMKEDVADANDPTSFVHYPGMLSYNVVEITLRPIGSR
jgi:hypothetical protein